MPDPSPSPQQPPPPGAEPKYYTMPERFLAITRGKAAAPSAPRPSLPSAAPPVAAPVAATFRSPSGDVASAHGDLKVAATPKLQQPAPGAGKRRMMLIWGSVGAVVVIGGAIAAWWVLRTIPAQVVSRESRVERSENTQREQQPAPTPAASGVESQISNLKSQIPLVPPPPPPELPVEPETQPQAPVVDGDGDGMTSTEEQLFGTDDANEDTDGDGYTDRAEILNLYHPGSTEPARLLDAGLVYEYQPSDAAAGWSAYIPRDAMVLDEDSVYGSMQTVKFGTDSAEEAIVFTVVQYASGLELAEWANQRPDGRALPPLEDVSSARGATGVRRAGEPVFFALAPGRALRIEHRFTSDTPRYATVYEMVVRSVAGAVAAQL